MGYTIYRFHYNENFGQVRIDVLVKRFAKFVDGLDVNPTFFCGFSQGGLIVSAYAEQYLKKKTSLFVICAPLRGSYDAYLLPLRGFKDLQPSSAFMEKHTRMLEKTRHNYWSVWGVFDPIVTPGNSGKIGTSFEIMLPTHTFSGWIKKTKDAFRSFLSSLD
jgi:pimeloyl-ACP methyl ester carboxylesterase